MTDAFEEIFSGTYTSDQVSLAVADKHLQVCIFSKVIRRNGTTGQGILH